VKKPGQPRKKSLKPERQSRTDGTQAIRRAVSILKVIASGGAQGISLAQVSESLRVTRSTTHRMLKCLAEEGLLQTTKEHRYKIGSLAYELSLSVVNDFHAASLWYNLIQDVAQKTSHTTYLLARSGMEAVCILKAESRAMLRVIPVEVGQRRPLGVGAGGIALLSSLDASEIKFVVEKMTAVLPLFARGSPEDVIADAQQARKRGYSISRGRVIENVIGLGFLLPATGAVRLAMSIAAPASSIRTEDEKALASMVKAEIAKFVERIGLLNKEEHDRGSLSEAHDNAGALALGSAL
jgi:DNA-binding IclR family transcriptional regulator